MDPNPLWSMPYLTREMLAFHQGAAVSLIVNTIATTTAVIEVRGFTREGPFTFRITPSAANTEDTNSFRIPDIPIQVSVLYDPNVSGGEIAHVQMHLGINENRITLLTEGPVTVFQGVSWPISQPPSHVSVEGQVTTVLGINQAAGNDIEDTVPNGQTWELLAMNFTLVTDATVADRTVAISIESPSGEIIRRITGTTQQATETTRYHALPGGTNAAVVANTVTEIALPPKIILPSGSTLMTITANLQAGDNYGAAEYTVSRHYARQD